MPQMFLSCLLRTEGHSVALLEAMASGLPLVASNIEGSRISIESGVNGFLFETGNSQELAEKLKIVLTDDKLQRVMSSNSSKIYRERFSTQTLIQNHLKITIHFWINKYKHKDCKNYKTILSNELKIYQNHQ